MANNEIKDIEVEPLIIFSTKALQDNLILLELYKVVGQTFNKLITATTILKATGACLDKILVNSRALVKKASRREDYD